MEQRSIHLFLIYMRHQLTLWVFQRPPHTLTICGKRLDHLLHTTIAHNTGSSPRCHSVIPGLRLTSLPSLIAVIMAWRWNETILVVVLCVTSGRAVPLFRIQGYTIKKSFHCTSCLLMVWVWIQRIPQWMSEICIREMQRDVICIKFVFKHNVYRNNVCRMYKIFKGNST